MPPRRTGVRTIPGHLTHYLEEVDLSRKELAELLNVSVRTVHNIEHGRKPVDPKLLKTLADGLNQRARELRRPDYSDVTADHFVNDPGATANVFLHTILTQDCAPLFRGDHPIGSADLRWIAPGDPRVIPYAGDYVGWDIQSLLDRLHSSVELMGVDQVKILKDEANSIVVIRSVSRFRHLDSGDILYHKAYVDMEMQGNRVQTIDSTYDAAALSEFLLSGVAPRARKSQAELN